MKLGEECTLVQVLKPKVTNYHRSPLRAVVLIVCIFPNVLVINLESNLLHDVISNDWKGMYDTGILGYRRFYVKYHCGKPV